MSQLRRDIVRTFVGAQNLVVRHAPGQDGLAGALMRWLDGATRFVEPHPEIVEARRLVYQGADDVIEIERNTGRILNRVGRRHVLSALADMEVAIYTHGRASNDADRVGIAVAGSPI